MHPACNTGFSGQTTPVLRERPVDPPGRKPFSPRTSQARSHAAGGRRHGSRHEQRHRLRVRRPRLRNLGGQIWALFRSHRNLLGMRLARGVSGGSAGAGPACSVAESVRCALHGDGAIALIGYSLLERSRGPCVTSGERQHASSTCLGVVVLAACWTLSSPVRLPSRCLPPRKHSTVRQEANRSIPGSWGPGAPRRQLARERAQPCRGVGSVVGRVFAPHARDAARRRM